MITEYLDTDIFFMPILIAIDQEPQHKITISMKQYTISFLTFKHQPMLDKLTEAVFTMNKEDALYFI